MHSRRAESCKKRSDTVCIIGLFYWDTSNCNIASLQRFQSRNTLFVTVPPRNLNSQMEALCECRNKWIRENNKIYLPLAEMVGSNSFPFHRTFQDQMHFQCAFHGLFQDGNFRYTPLNELDVKAPANKDCRDLLNLNLAMIIAHYWEHRL